MSCPQNCSDPLDVVETDGCLSPINSECVIINAGLYPCLGIPVGANLNQALGFLETIFCASQAQLANLHNFTCSELEGCILGNLGDVNIVSPITNQYLIYNGTDWVNTNIPSPFSCSTLNGCNINDLGNVNASPTNGQYLVWDSGTSQWIAGTISASNVYDVINGLTESPSGTFKLGGALTGNTSITGTFDLHLGTSGSALDDFTIYANKILGRGTVLSFSETGDTATQTKGFLYKTAGTSLSIGTDVFDDFDTYTSYRIGDNITLAKTGLVTPTGIFIGSNITIDSAIAFALGEGITLTGNVTTGAYIGSTLHASNGIGGYLFGDNLSLIGNNTGFQSAWMIGTQINLTYPDANHQSHFVLNLSDGTAIQGSNGGGGANEKIKTASNLRGVVINADDYFFYTDCADTTGWATHPHLSVLNKTGFRVPINAAGTAPDYGAGTIRFNGTDFQGWDGANWLKLNN